MKHTLLPILVAAALFTGCSSAYKSSQTPDDVYYSPARAVKEHAYADNDDDYADNYTSSEDNYLRMKMRNRYRWSAIDDYDYWNSPNYAFNNYYGSYGAYNPYFNNSWYSAYYSPFSYGYGSLYPSIGFGWYDSYYPSYGYGVYTPIYVVKSPTRVNTVSRSTYLGGYLNRGYNNGNTQGYSSLRGRAFTPSVSNGYNNSNGARRNTYYNFNNGRNNNTYNSNNNNNNNSYTPSSSSRSYTPSSSSSSSSGSSSHSSGGGSVSRPPR